jgi:hypothetical protein
VYLTLAESLFLAFLAFSGINKLRVISWGQNSDSPRLHQFSRKVSLSRVQVPNLSAARALAFAASSSRFLAGAVVSSERRSRAETLAISSMAAENAASLAFEGLLNPLIFLTN